jgi:hypothetical protein
MFRMKNIAVFLFLIVSHISVYAQKFKPGVYYDKKGEKHQGFIRHVIGNCGFGPCNNIQFIKNKQSKKLKLSVHDISSFIIESDSFTITNLKQFEALGLEQKDFIQIIELGKINLYLHHSKVESQYGSFKVETPILSKEGLIASTGKSTYYERIPTFFNGASELYEKSLEFNTIQELRTIVNEYNKIFPIYNRMEHIPNMELVTYQIWNW